MSAFTVPHTRAAEWPLPWGRLGKALAQLANGAPRRWRIRHDLERVRGFDDRMMADLGLARCDVDRVGCCGRGVDEIRGRLITG